MAAPSLSFTIEPSQSSSVSYLRCAPTTAGAVSRGILNIFASLKNTGSSSIEITKLELSVIGSSTAAKPFTVSKTLAASGNWNWTQSEDYLFDVPASPQFQLRVFASGYSEPAVFKDGLLAHKNPTPDGSYRFWAALRDLRPGEFWQVHGTGHGQSNYAQLFAYDVGVSVDNGGSSHHGLLPSTDGSKNEHYRIWGKPIYAIADGTVRHFRNDFPGNTAPSGTLAQNIQDLITAVGDGNGNFFTIASGDETVLYAHLQKGSLNPALLSSGIAVTRGTFLGLAGNSGASSNPHLHIHVNRTNTGSKSWVDVPRPMNFRDVRAVSWTAVGTPASDAPWSELNGRGIPPTDCAVWPAAQSVVGLKESTLLHFAISTQGQPWLIKADKKIRTSHDRLPGHGVFFGVDPGGLAKEISVYGQKPYVIGTDDKLWEGLPDKWSPVSGSPACRRISVDPANGTVWAISSDERIFSFTPASKAWKEHPGGGRGKDICVFAGTPYVIGMDDHIWKSAGSAGWSKLPGEGKGKRIAIDAENGKLWVIGMNDGIWSHLGSGNWSEHPGEGRAKDLQIHNHTAYVRGMDDGLWCSAGANGWRRLNLVEPA